MKENQQTTKKPENYPEGKELSDLAYLLNLRFIEHDYLEHFMYKIYTRMESFIVHIKTKFMVYVYIV